MSVEDRANLRYLALHQIPQTLEKLTKNLLHDQPDNPLEFMMKCITEIRIANKTKNIEDYIKTQSHPVGDPPFKLGNDAREFTAKQPTQMGASERDDSIRSESSTFSVTSVDLADFLQEFRQAYVQQTRGRRVNGRLTKIDLGEIIDYVAFPTPDKMLTDMFSEIDIDGEGSVEFEVFLARMSYKIQGRFSNDILKAMFRSVALDNNVLNVEDVGRVFLKLGMRISDRELAELSMRYSNNKRQASFEEFQRMVHHHTATLPGPPASGLVLRPSGNSDSQDLEDD